MRNKKILAATLIVLLLLCTAAGFQAKAYMGDGKEKVNIDALPIKTIQASFVCDPYNIREKVGIVDYVFVGEVVECGKTQYKDAVTIENENVGIPYTPYKVNVLSNIKGSLYLNEPIPILKFGGVSQDEMFVLLHEDDVLPQEGQKYVFLAFAQPDGSLLVSGPNSNIPFENDPSVYNNEEADPSNSLYDIYTDAYENEVVFDRERFVSAYEN